ncbi:TonB-dependent receptor [Aliidiomarina minuta]|uniref:TonB-dependent receptor n=1 Tax=Aliidiomarina minuta TaxID=880057 RepID=A0A432W4A2_9GAMM|nr:TonB-dependent receptor [Aliidiomarina minuta]RUO24331.1 TonB-dependent receptor [Aliidiomarina minuta]
MKSAFRFSLCAVAISSAFASPSLLAQQQAAEAEPMERVQVTGSRINRTDVEGASPISIINRDEIDASGYTNLQQILERMPSAGVGTFSTRGNSQDSTANGGAAISLRGLGSDATLVLINGRRVAVSSFAEGVANSFVDINSIPVAAIERVEVLKDGASAIYGSDAVAGVVNIILRDDFVGTEAAISYGGTTGPNYDETNLSTVWGAGDSDSNTTVIFDYFKNGSIMGSEMGRFGTANQAPYGGLDLRSSRGFPGNFVVDGEVQIDPDCPADSTFGVTCVYDYGPFTMTIPEAERMGAMVLMNRRLNRNLEGYVEFNAQHNRSKAGGAATPLDGDAGLTVPGDHPDNPFGQDVEINRFRTVDAGPRVWSIESDTLRLVTGLRGDLGTWNWDVAFQKGRNASLQTGGRDQGWVRTDMLQEEINAGRYNPFGGTVNSPEVIDAITTSLTRRGKSHITSVDGSIAGEAFQLGDHYVSMAAGFEYREEDVFDRPDDQFQRGLIFGTESVQAEAEREQWAAYLEFLVPLTDDLEFTASGRYDDYSDFGSTFNPQFKVQWRATEEVRFRASYGQGFRAPSLAQIGLGPSEVSQFFTDTYRCPDNDPNNPACGATDYVIVFTGNEDLDAEESENWNIGAVWQINQDWDLAFDYWSITQDNKIDRNDFEAVYQEHCNDQDSTVCVRQPPQPGNELGELSVIYNSYVNVSSQEAAGIDFSTNYRVPFDLYGDLRLSLDWSYMTHFEKNDIDYLGEYNYPKNRWTGSADWTRNGWGVTATVSYIGEFQDYKPPQEVETTSVRTVSSQALLDLQVRYDLTESLRMSVGGTNVLDEEPPFAIGDMNNDLYGYVSGVHNPRGRFIYARLNYSF